MRGILLSVVLAGAFAIAAPTTRAAAAVTTVPAISAATPPVYALQVPDKQIEITVNDRGGVRGIATRSGSRSQRLAESSFFC